MQLFRQAVYVWRIARLMYVSAGTGLSLVLLCKYEAVVLLPYIMMLLTPDFYIYHRHLLLCLSQIAAALTVGMIATTGGCIQAFITHSLVLHMVVTCACAQETSQSLQLATKHPL